MNDGATFPINSDDRSDPIRRCAWATAADRPDDDPPEWLVSNGLGGYACGTITGLLTRRYHGLLIAALPVPLGRMVMLDQIVDTVTLADGRNVRLDDGQIGELGQRPDAGCLDAFRLELGLPVWRFAINDLVIERRLVMLHGRNTVVLSWRLLEGPERVRLDLQPFLHVRPSDAKVGDNSHRSYRMISEGDRHWIDAGDDVPALKLSLRGGEAVSLRVDAGNRREIFYGWEAKRGYDCRGALWSPGRFAVDLLRGRDAVLTISTDPWETVTAPASLGAISRELARRRALIVVAHPSVSRHPADELVLAADSFIITPPRAQPTAIQAGGDPFRTVIAGYHWFTDWGRDTMISLEGLTLVTGRHAEARGILRTFAQHIRDGLIPNLFPEHDDDGIYNTADATLWFFHALDRYLDATGDRDLLRELLPKLIDIVRHHLDGTHFGIGVDSADGLLRQGADGYQLTWMDAKVDDWVVTPRRGKAVEINALWYNALRLLAGWIDADGATEPLPQLAEAAKAARESFNRRFWYEAGGYLYDVVDGETGDDASLRPNQLLAISLRHPVLERNRWQAVVDVVTQRLLTPVGLRSLAEGHADFRPTYTGDLRARDAAYHQGTVWGWLIGPYIDARLKLDPGERQRLRAVLSGFTAHLDEGCIGSISEVFDAEAPFTPRGCIAQAWSVAEFLRCWRLVYG